MSTLHVHYILDSKIDPPSSMFSGIEDQVSIFGFRESSFQIRDTHLLTLTLTLTISLVVGSRRL